MSAGTWIYRGSRNMGNLILLLTLNGAFLVLMFLYFRYRIRREFHPDRMLESIRQETELLIADLNKTADRNIQVMEDRVKRLKEQISQADRRITLLKRDRERMDARQGLYTSLGRSAGMGETGMGETVMGKTVMGKTVLPGEDQNRKNSADNRRDTGAVEEPAETEDSGAEGAGATEPGAAESGVEGAGGPGEEELSEQVRRLYSQGFSADMIARKLQASVSEVELIISLVQNRW